MNAYAARFDASLDPYLLWVLDRRQRLHLVCESYAVAWQTGGKAGLPPQAMHELITLNLAAEPEPIDETPGRPPVREVLEQMPCTPATAQARARLLGDGPVLLLGDDDLVSLACPQADVLELDPALVEFLPRARSCDLRLGLPADCCGRYPTVATDPPYTRTGFTTFLQAAVAALAPGGRLLVSTNLELADAPAFEFFGLQVQERHRAFNRYPCLESFRVQCEQALLSAELPEPAAAGVASFPYVFSDLFVLTVSQSSWPDG